MEGGVAEQMYLQAESLHPVSAQSARRSGTTACFRLHMRGMHAGEEGDVRLVGDTAKDVAFGVPEIFHAGAWGTFCDGDDFRFDYFEGSQYSGISTFNDVRGLLPSCRPLPVAASVPCVKIDAESQMSCMRSGPTTKQCCVPVHAFLKSVHVHPPRLGTVPTLKERQ